MSVVSRQFIHPQRSTKKKVSVSPARNKEYSGSRSQPLTLTPQPPKQPVEKFPKPKLLPPWLRSLQKLERNSSILTLLLITLALVAYGWTVYTQQQWTKQYRRLESLQRQEREMRATNEILKNQLATDAEKAGLQPPDPAKIVFIQPAPQRPPQVTPAIPPNLEPKSKIPIGY